VKFVIAMMVVTAGGAASAQQPDWPQATKIEITLSSFKISPEKIELKQGKAYTITIHNSSRGGHDFVAEDFFAAATIAPEDRAHLHDGEVELAGGASVDLHLKAPATAGKYEVHCSHFLHAGMGMKGSITVEGV
jgi:uncharacterized cupredoxin-like copper-binding protein